MIPTIYSYTCVFDRKHTQADVYRMETKFKIFVHWDGELGWSFWKLRVTRNINIILQLLSVLQSLE